MKLSKKEKEELIRLSKIHHISSTSVKGVFYKRLHHVLCNRLARIDLNPEPDVMNSNTVANIYSAFFGGSSTDIFNRSIYNFYINNQKTEFLNSLVLSTRLEYIKNLLVGNRGTRTDCYHVWNLMNAYIINDNQVIKGYLKIFSPPFKEGWNYNILIGNIIYKHLGAEYNFNIIEEIEKYKPSTKFEKNTMQALKAVFTNNQKLFNEHTEMVIKGYKRTYFAIAFEKYYPFFPIFLTILNYRTNNQLYFHSSIDEFTNIIQNNDIEIDKTEYMHLVKQNSKTLYKWISKAPSSINYSELKDEMLLKIKNN